MLDLFDHTHLRPTLGTPRQRDDYTPARRRLPDQPRDLGRVLVFVLDHLGGNGFNGYAPKPLMLNRAVNLPPLAVRQQVVKFTTRRLHAMDDLRDSQVLGKAGIVVVERPCAGHERFVLCESGARARHEHALHPQQVREMYRNAPLLPGRHVAELFFAQAAEMQKEPVTASLQCGPQLINGHPARRPRPWRLYGICLVWSVPL
ncbi:MAG: hypothetical protein M3P30_03645 [Chloroflexota bacterium]|nr:hypothetical protein [Chloroflexota bacterium]